MVNNFDENTSEKDEKYQSDNIHPLCGNHCECFWMIYSDYLLIDARSDTVILSYASYLCFVARYI